MSMSSRGRQISAGLALLVLTACGNAPENGGNAMGEAFGLLRGALQGGGAQAQRLQPVGAFPGIDPALVAGRTEPTIGAYIANRQALAGLVRAARNGGTTTWMTADGVSLSFAGGGVLTATRGLGGGDLHGVDAAQTIALIAAGNSGIAQRRHMYLDGIYRQQTITLRCMVTLGGAETLTLNGRSHNTLRFDERCEGAGEAVSNSYWRDAAGPLVRQSVQWIGPELGSVHLQTLIE